MSTFGGPKDTGMSADEGLALFTQADLQNPKYSYLFLPTPPPGTTGLGQRLNPSKYYFACRWNSCPNKLFGPVHSQATIAAAWVAANV